MIKDIYMTSPDYSTFNQYIKSLNDYDDFNIKQKILAYYDCCSIGDYLVKVTGTDQLKSWYSHDYSIDGSYIVETVYLHDVISHIKIKD